MQKVVLSVLVFSILIVGFNSIQDVYAVAPDCSTATLAVNTFYVSDNNNGLHKVTANTPIPNTCFIGTITDNDDAVDPRQVDMGTFVGCQDIAIDHSNGKLYCLGFGSILYELERTATDFVGGTVLATEVGGLLEGATPRGDANAMDIDSYGRAYLAIGGVGTSAGNFYNVDLTSGALTLRTAFGTNFVSAGDLARDESTSFDMYWTVLCSGMTGGATDPTCVDAANDRLYRITLNDIPGSDSLTPLAELSKGRVFAMDIIQPNFNLCMLNEDGFMFETDRDGVEVKMPVLVSPLILAFGASGNDIGGAIVMINLASLALAATQTNAAWLLLFALSGVAVIAYQFKGKTKSKNKKIQV